MNTFEKNQIEDLIASCKSELLNHALQDQVLSPNIKKINSYLDDCLIILESVRNATPTPRNTRSPKAYGKARENILFIAYCMSKLDYQFVNAITGQYYNQTEVFTYLSQKLQMKTASLRNYRDAFDYHVDQLHSNRVGWKKELPSDLIDIKEKFDSYSEHELIDHAKTIIQSL